MSVVTPSGRNEADHLDTLTGAYALDALDDVERVRVERHLRECAECRAEVTSFAETTARLAAGVAVPPPVSVRDAVLAEVGRTRQLSPASGPSHRRGGPAVAARWLAGAAALLLAVGVGLGTAAWQWRDEARQAQQAASGLQDVLAAPDRQVVDVEFPQGRGTVVAAGQDVALVTQDVPGPGEDLAYQMWFVAEGDIRSAGLLEPTGGGQWWAEASGLRSGDAVAVSVEPAGGSTQPTTDPVMVAPIPG